MRDGSHLNATIYSASNRAAPRPCIIAMTPYTADVYHEHGVYFASRGISFVAVDVRGRGNSPGAFKPNRQDARDGYDAVEWVARQSYCNGKVAMCGGSYAGHNQWTVAAEVPPHLTTIVPVAAPYIGVDFPMRNNIFYPYAIQWITLTSGCASQSLSFNDSAFWSSLFRRWAESGRPFREVDAMLGNPSHVFQEWVSHPERDAYWDGCNPSPQQYARLDLPILTVTGCYDDDQPGALEHYRQHLRNTSPTGRERHYLIIGPWDHAGTRAPQSEYGGIIFGPESLLDMRKLHLEWYAWTMQDGTKPGFLRKPVAYYVMGAETWRYADTLEHITERHEPYYLDSKSNATDVFSSGTLSSMPGKGPPDTYTYDPGDVSKAEIPAEEQTAATSQVDQSVTLALSGRLLVYHSAPFEETTEVSGFFRLSAWIAIDCPDTDLYATIFEITRSGASIRLTSDAIRARYRESLRTPELIRTREALLYKFERFTFTSRQFQRGHRLRLVVSPVGRLIESTFVQKNYNGGGIVSEESAEDARAVTVKLFHDEAHPSVLYVPIARERKVDELTAPSAAFAPSTRSWHV